MIPPDCKIACGEQSPQAKKCSAPHRGNVLRSKKPPLQKFCGGGFIERIDLVRAGFAGASMHAPPVPPATASACRPAVSDRVCPGRTAPGTWLPMRRTAPSGARPATPAVCCVDVLHDNGGELCHNSRPTELQRQGQLLTGGQRCTCAQQSQMIRFQGRTSKSLFSDFTIFSTRCRGNLTRKMILQSHYRPDRLHCGRRSGGAQRPRYGCLYSGL